MGFCKGFNLDETGSNAFLYRPYAYSAKSAPVRAKISGKRYQRFSLVAAYVEGQLVAPMTYQQTMDSTLFEAWFEHFLMPSLTEKSLIIMDNARFHRISVLKGIAEQKGHKVLPLPPYSPELNPIEKIWANIKRELRKILPSYSCFMEALLGTFISLNYKERGCPR